MKHIIITGSLAYDRIMDFGDQFKNHIMPDKVHMLSVSFTIQKLDEKFGGTSGNIAHNFKLLGVEPIIVAAVGKDFEKYKQSLESRGIATRYIAIDQNAYTAVGTIINDTDNNQITAFYPGAYELSAKTAIPQQWANKESFLIIAPSSPKEIPIRCNEAQFAGIPYLFDPGQVIPALSGDELRTGIAHCTITSFNDYEWELVAQKTGYTIDDIRAFGIVLVITKGKDGSVIYTKDEEFAIPIAQPAQVIDPTGAGDAYRAGLIYGYMHGFGWRESGQLGATLASFAIEQYGTQEHSPSVKVINERYKKNFNAESPL